MPLPRILSLLVLFVISAPAFAQSEFLVKFNSDTDGVRHSFTARHGGSLRLVSRQSELYQWSSSKDIDLKRFDDKAVRYVQRNHAIKLMSNPSLVRQREQIVRYLADHPVSHDLAFSDNPDFKEPAIQASGADKQLSESWGIFKIGADTAWQKLPQGKGIVVAVTDTGVDYNHQDLIHNIWKNKGETMGDGIDNDNNGYVDDISGWDFFSDDNKPYDLSMSMMEILLQGGNPGHGTHVAGVVGSRLSNSIGTAGVAPLVKIMPLRFLGEKGQGDTAGAVKAIDYAIANGANIINASWGSEGEEEGDEALREAIQRAEAAGVLFVAAAGNGRLEGSAPKGYNNDTDPKPAYPASYPYENIVAVAALDEADKLAEFSNFGQVSVDLGAPGVKILSTVPGDKYQHTIINLGSMQVTWDGTSMAAPFVAGTLAQILSTDRTIKASEAKALLLESTKKVSDITGKVATDGRLDLAGITEE